MYDDTNQAVTFAQPVVPAGQQAPSQQAPAAPAVPIGLPQKEQAPIVEKGAVAPEVITPSEPEPKIDQEVKEAGVEKVSDKLTLTDEHKALGIEHAKESTPVATKTLDTIKLPMSEEETLRTIKTTSKSDSKHWLAVLIEKIYKILKS